MQSMAMANRKAERDALYAWAIPRIPDDVIAAHLTFSCGRFTGLPPSQESCAKTIRHFIRKIQRAAFGHGQDRNGTRLEVLAIREGGMRAWDKHLHYHLLIGVRPKFSCADFRRICAEIWSKLKQAGVSRFVVCHDHGAIDYALKLRDKPNYQDAFDVCNTHLKP
jgi:hypothetical protein